MTVNRTTSIYTLTVQATDWKVLDRLTDALPVDRAGSGVDTDHVFIRFRVADDAEAARITRAVVQPGDDFALTTGNGVSKRTVEVDQ